MKPRITTQTRKLERPLLAAVRKQLGRNFVALICIGSRATGDDRPDSDYDAFCFVRDARRAKLDLSELESRFGVALGVAVKNVGVLTHPPTSLDPRPFWALPVTLKLGQARLVGGRNLFRHLPLLKELLPSDWRRAAQLNYWLAITPGLPTNVQRADPRRQVGFIIETCALLLLSRGVAVHKEDMPTALRKHHPKFAVVGLLRRALRRRIDWSRLGTNRAEHRRIRQDLDRFLRVLRRHVFTGVQTDLKPAEAVRWRLAARAADTGPTKK